MSAAFEIIFFKERRLRMSAALNSVIIFRRQNGDILLQRHLKLVYFIVKRQFFSMSRICNEKCSKPKIFLAFLSKLLCFSFIL